MADPELQEQAKRAGQLRSLADHIEDLPKATRDFSTKQMKQWAGPHADDVRGDLGGWKTKCENVAEALREVARQCDQAVKDAKDPKKDK
ncbi:hypothetical protein ACFWZT_26940 [Streptomyces alboflavus]|uniref:hypothetical protein n=1 Tax=Streptomyces TaxID=1883 RepID=UPI0004BE4B24|nr:hypothetical protein [Streptomyces alboflavus]